MNNEEKILALLEKQSEMIGQINGRLDGIDGRLDALEAAQAEMRETLTRVAVTQENIILPRLETLAEGHAHLLNTLASKKRVEALEDEVSTIKAVVKATSSRVAALEKAQ